VALINTILAIPLTLASILFNTQFRGTVATLCKAPEITPDVSVVMAGAFRTTPAIAPAVALIPNGMTKYLDAKVFASVENELTSAVVEEIAGVITNSFDCCSEKSVVYQTKYSYSIFLFFGSIRIQIPDCDLNPLLSTNAYLIIKE
jgi:hypothetical protein